MTCYNKKLLEIGRNFQTPSPLPYLGNFWLGKFLIFLDPPPVGKFLTSFNHYISITNFWHLISFWYLSYIFWKESFINEFFSNKVPVIRDILKSNQIACDSRHFEGKSRIGMSGGRGRNICWFSSCFWTFRAVWRGSYIFW